VLDEPIFKPYYFPMSKVRMNVVGTTREMNMAAAQCCETFNKAVMKFRALQYANDMGTGGPDFDELEKFFIEKQGLYDYLEKGFNVACASDQEAGVIPKIGLNLK
tara:strand:+ start:269 stop:583 length:315 start_codon:yes stop_codon:yes gene_type:complete